MVYSLYDIDHLTFQLLTLEVDKKGDNPVMSPRKQFRFIPITILSITIYRVTTAVNHVMINLG